MSLVSLALTIIVVGLLLWLVNAYIPMEATVKKILNGVIILVLVLWILQAFGLLGGARGVHVGSLDEGLGAPVAMVHDVASA